MIDPAYQSPLCLPLTAALVGALARMTEAIGSADWFDAVLNLLGTVCAIDSGGAMVCHREQRPRRILHRFDPAERSLPEDAYLSKELERYFPQPLQAKYAKAMQQHRLKREIIATAVTNSTINRMGATFLLRMQEDSGRSPGEVAKAFTITRETLDARELWAQVDALDGKVAESVQIDALQVIWEIQRSFTRWLLSRPGAIPDITSAVARFHDGFRDIRAGEGILPASQRPAYEASLKAGETRMVLSPDSPFFRFFNDPQGRGKTAPKP